MNKYIDSFLDIFEKPDNFIEATPNQITKYDGRLPNALLDVWKQLGFSGFCGGLFWITNPDDYEELLNEWVDKSPLKDLNEKFYVIARSGYGDLYLYGENCKCQYEINMMNAWILKRDPSEDTEDLAILKFFGSKSPYGIDIEDINTDEEIFEDAIEKLGPLEVDEILGFTPILVAGGQQSIEYLQKTDLSIYSNLILQFTSPQVLTDQDLANMAFS